MRIKALSLAITLWMGLSKEVTTFDDQDRPGLSFLEPDAVQQHFIVYTCKQFDQAKSLNVYTLSNANDRFAIPRHDGEMIRSINDSTRRTFNGVSTKMIKSIDSTRRWTIGADQYIHVEFDHGAKVWYKQPRWARGTRDRPDTWVKGKPGIFTNNGHKLVKRPLSAYPTQLIITRPRNADDPARGVDYEFRMDMVKRVIAPFHGVEAGMRGFFVALRGLADTTFAFKRIDDRRRNRPFEHEKNGADTFLDAVDCFIILVSVGWQIPKGVRMAIQDSSNAYKAVAPGEISYPRAGEEITPFYQ